MIHLQISVSVCALLLFMLDRILMSVSERHVRNYLSIGINVII